MNKSPRLISVTLVLLLSFIQAHAETPSLLQKAKEEKNPTKAITLYWQYFTEVKGDSAYVSAADDFAELLAENHRLMDLVRFGDHLAQQRPAPASPMNTIAWALAEADTALDKALIFSQLAVAGQRQNLLLPAPPERSPVAWKERQTNTLGYYLDTQGYVWLQQDNFKKAVEVLQQADSLLPEGDYEVYVHLGLAYLKAGNPKAAFQQAVKAKFYLSDRESAENEAVLKESYALLHGSSEGLEDFLKNSLQTMKSEEYASLVVQKLNKPAPEFALTSLEGKTVQLSDYRGRIVLVDFWATWCGPCKRELPLLQEAYPKWKEQNIEMLAISTDKETEKVAPFIQEKKYTFPVLFTQNTSKAYDVSVIPTLFVVDRNGMIQYRHLGYRPDVVDILNLQIKELTKVK